MFAHDNKCICVTHKSKSLKYQLDMYILFWYKQTLNNFGLDRDDNILKEPQW